VAQDHNNIEQNSEIIILLLLQDIYRALQYVKNITQRWTYFVYNISEQFMPMVNVK